MPPFLGRLIQEHQIFLAAFEILFEKTKGEIEAEEKMELFKSLFKLCKVFYEDFHEAKEENVLFPHLAADPSIYAGGPECVYHFDLQMQSPPLKIAEKACSESGLEARPVQFPMHLQDLVEAQSPLVIPMEDHQAGKLLLNAAAPLLAQPLETSSVRKLQTLFAAYQEIQVRHIRKEEGCLFCLTRLLIYQPAAWQKLEAEELYWSPQKIHPLVDELFQQLTPGRAPCL
ncbi:MAG: hypothetical protein AB7H48_02435 [Parachlamydiales bacterium]